MSEENPYFNLPGDEKNQKLIAAILTQATCQLLPKEPDVNFAKKRVAQIYHSILNPKDPVEVWEQLGG